MSRLPKGVHAVTKRRPDGTERTYFYWRATRAPLPDPASPGFAKALREAKMAGPAAPSGTFGSLIAEYRRAPAYTSLAPTTRRSYLAAFDRLADLHRQPLSDFRRRHALQIRDGMADQPGNAKVLLKVLSMLLNFAVEREYLEANVAKGVAPLAVGEHQPWPVAALDFAMRTLPEHLRRAFLLALYSGQRRGDCAAMLWSQYDGEGIEVTQIKTGARLWVPCHSALRGELEAWRKGAKAVTILVNFEGLPWASSASLGTGFSDFCRRHRELDGLTFHGLRKTAGAMLAEAGCTPHEIAAITGHQSLAMVQHYTKGADQRRRATAAVHKLEAVTPRFTKKA